MKLVGQDNSSFLREKVYKKYNLGYGNAKTLMKRLSSVGIKKAYSRFGDFLHRKLKVSFKYNKKKYVKYSGTKQTNGYDSVFLKYSDAQITILYSPQFDEVMILDDKT